MRKINLITKTKKIHSEIVVANDEMEVLENPNVN